MFHRNAFNSKKAKTRSEELIKQFGGKVCDWLPQLDTTRPKSREQLIGRALVMNAMLNIHFQAPTPYIRSWINEHSLMEHVSGEELKILETPNASLSEQTLINLYWYIEALWALLWAGGIVNEMHFDQCIPNSMASLCPDLQKGEGPEKFTQSLQTRPPKELLTQLDLYYRLHWWTRDGQLNGYSTDPVSIDIIMERRKALEWVCNRQVEWDDVPLDT